MFTFLFLLQSVTYADSLGASVWAKEEVDAAISMGFIPEDMQNGYQENMTRAEFAKLSVLYVARHFNMEVPEMMDWYLSVHTENGGPMTFKEGVFTDIEDPEYKYYIECANTLVILEGRGEGIFDPDAYITRQEAAKMLLRVYFCYGSGVKLGPKSEGVDAFYDKAEIASWADSAVRYMYQWDVMKGVSANYYAPRAYYTKEQCYITFLRLADVYSIG